MPDNVVKLQFDLAQTQAALEKSQAAVAKLREEVRKCKNETVSANDSGSKSYTEGAEKIRKTTKEIESQNKEVRELGKSLRGMGGAFGSAFGEERLSPLVGKFAAVGVAASAMGTIVRAAWQTIEKDIGNATKAIGSAIEAQNKYSDTVKSAKEKSGERGLTNLETERNLIAATGSTGSVQDARKLAETYALPGGFKEAAGLMTQVSRPINGRTTLTKKQQQIAIQGAILASQSGLISSGDAMKTILTDRTFQRIVTTDKSVRGVRTDPDREIAARLIRMKEFEGTGRLAAISGRGSDIDYMRTLDRIETANTSVSGRQLRRLFTIGALNERVDASRGDIGISSKERDLFENISPGGAFVAAESKKMAEQEAIAYAKEKNLREKQSSSLLNRGLYLNATGNAADESRAIVEENSAKLQALLESSLENKQDRALMRDVLTRMATALSERGF